MVHFFRNEVPLHSPSSNFPHFELMKKLLFLIALFPLWLQAQETTDPLIRVLSYQVEYRINPDATHTQRSRYEVKALKERGVEFLKQRSLSHSTSVETARVIAAFTRKADGREIPVRPDSYQFSVSSGRDKANPAFSDRTSATVIFPELAVGDSVVLEHEIATREPIFPGHFSVHEGLDPNSAMDEAVIRFIWPVSLDIRHEVHGLPAPAVVEKDGMRQLEVKFSNPKPAKSKRKDWSVIAPNDGIGIRVSTFKNYQEIAEAYYARAKPKAAVTPRIQKLADEVVGAETDKLKQARALYEWVSRNISYFGNCVGIGAVVPRDLDFVLDNRGGDCKDHATLLEALLNAKGIRSEQALVNASTRYELAKIPVVSEVNHVITYLPDWDRFVDSTSDSTPFDALPHGDQGKPVLLGKSFREGMRTPGEDGNRNRQVLKAKMKISEDGSVSGKISVSLTGVYAINARARDREMTEDNKTEMLKAMFDRRETGKGFGKLTGDDPKPLTDVYAYTLEFAAEEFVRLPGAGAFSPYAAWPGEAPVYGFFASSNVRDMGAEKFSCHGGRSEELLEIELPKNMKVLSVPKPAKIKLGYQTYESSMVLKGRQLTVKRSVIDTTPGVVCDAKVAAEYFDMAQKVSKDLGAQIVYKD